MKRSLAIGAAVLVVLAAAWGLVWWQGRGEVDRALDTGVAQMREQGWTVAWDSREISGFPFGYSVRLTGLTASDDEGGLALRLPWALAETDGTDRLVIRFPEKFALDLPVPADSASGTANGSNATATGDASPGPGTSDTTAPDTPTSDTAASDTSAGVTVSPAATPPTVLATTGEASELVMVLSKDGSVGVTADRLAWTVDEPEAGRTMTQTLENLAVTTTPDAPGARYRLQAALVGTDASVIEPDGQPSKTLATLRDVTIEGSTTIGAPRALGEMIYAGAPGQADAALTSGAAELHVVIAGTSPGTLDMKAEKLAATLALTSGRMELSGEAHGNAWNLASPDPALPVQGLLSVGQAKATYAMPMAPSEKPDEMAIHLSLQDVTADDRVWAQLDPGGALLHDPASLLIDLTGTARVTKRIDRLRPGEPPPFEISHLVFNDVTASALGATAKASGDVDILQPIGTPLGEIRLTVTGLSALVRALGRAGVLTPEMETTAEAIMTVYLSPAEGEDAWGAKIDFTHDGPMVNGKPVR